MEDGAGGGGLKSSPAPMPAIFEQIVNSQVNVNVITIFIFTCQRTMLGSAPAPEYFYQPESPFPDPFTSSEQNDSVQWDDVVVDMAVDGLLENRGHRRRIRFKPSAARPVLHFRQSKSAVPDRFTTSLNTGDSVER